MLDEIGQTVDHPCDQDLIVGKPEFPETAEFVGVARIGERQHQAADIGLEQHRQDILKGDVAIMWRFRIAPAYMQTHPLARDIPDRAVDGRYDLFDKADKCGNRLVLEEPPWRQCPAMAHS